MKVYTALSLVLILIFLSLAPFAVSKIVDSSNSNYFPKNNNNNIKPLEQNYIAYFNIIQLFESKPNARVCFELACTNGTC